MNTISDSWRRLKAAAGVDGNDYEGSKNDILQVLSALKLRDFGTLSEMAEGLVTKQPTDDRTYLMERTIQLAAEIPTSSVASQTLTNNFLNLLWTDLQHPPKSYLGNDYVFRKADGSNNNFLWPHVGAAGQPYARTIKSIKSQPVARPDPAVIFESVLKRKKFVPHPNKISVVLFYLASVIIHDIFHTNHSDFNISNTSSYLDLAPLYGNNLKSQEKMRTGQDGKIKPDCFADHRILGFPPGVGLLLIFFNRFHNNIVEKLAQIDENQRFSRILHPPGREPPEDAAVKYDEALFQTARLITTGLYINIILKDYVRTILNLNRVDSEWNLDPRSQEGKALFGEKIPEGSGNQVSAEFNLVYRWHSTVSERDAKWSEDAFKKLFPDGKKPATMDGFLAALKEWAHKLPADPLKRPFEDLKRDDQGRFDDDELARIWTDSVEDVAGAFGANHVPAILKDVEILGIMQARSWNLASLNEFRKYFNLKPWTSFKEMNPDEEVAEQLERLYEHPDNVELYPGIILEGAKIPMKPGSGLCTNFTVSRAVLSDAVALVRGDRFYTIDYTNSNLTNYGYAAANYDIHINHGCVFYKLVLNALPNNFTKDSIYAHYPLVVPSENKVILANMGREAFYSFAVPSSMPKAATVRSYENCKSVLLAAAKSATSSRLPLPTEISLKKELAAPNPQILATLRQYLTTKPDATYVKQYFTKVTLSLLKQQKYILAGINQVDIIRDVANIAQVHFAACVFGLPLKTEDNPTGAYQAKDLWAALIAIYSSLHSRQNPADSFKAQQTARPAVLQLGRIIEQNVSSADPKQHGILTSIIDMLHNHRSSDLTDESTHLIQSILKLGVSPQQLVYLYILPIAATVVVSQARAFADCLDYFLGAGTTHLPEINRLSSLNTKEADAQLELYALEALRINSKASTYALAPNALVVQNGSKKIDVAMHGLIHCDLVSRSCTHSSMQVSPS